MADITVKQILRDNGRRRVEDTGVLIVAMRHGAGSPSPESSAAAAAAPGRGSAARDFTFTLGEKAWTDWSGRAGRD